MRSPIDRRVRPAQLLDAVPYLIYGIVVPLVNLVAVAAADPLRRLVLFEDDAYYYFQIAHNLATGAGSSFNGLDLTNGYHPLWQMLLVPIFAIAPSKLAALVYVQAVVNAAWALSMFFAYRFARTIHREKAVALALIPFVVLGALLGLGPSGLYVSGMEVVLVVLGLFALLDFAASSRLIGDGVPTTRKALTAGATLALIVLARLDTAFFVVAFVIIVPLTWRTSSARERWAGALALAAPSAVLLAVYLTINQIAFGTPTPVSGQVKASGPIDLGTGPLRQFLENGVLLGHAIPLGWLTLAAVFAALAGAALTRRGGPRLRQQPLVVLLVVASTALGAQVLYLSTQSGWYVWSWYLYLVPFVFLLALVLLLDAPSRRLDGRRWVKLLPLTAAVLVVLPACARHLEIALEPGDPDSSFIAHARVTASWIDDHLPPDAVLAMGDRAGSLGYLVDRPVVQLEGLVESHEYLEALRAGTVAGFLRDHRVTHLVIDSDPSEQPGASGCVEHSEPRFGNGPKATLKVCAADRIYAYARPAAAQVVGVYRYTP